MIVLYVLGIAIFLAAAFIIHVLHRLSAVDKWEDDL